MISKDETRASHKRGCRAAPVSADKAKGETAVVDNGTNAITTDTAAALMSAPPPEQNAIAGGEQAVGEGLKANDAAVADAGVRAAIMTVTDSKPSSEISTPRPEHDDSKGQHVVTAEGGTDPISPKLATPRIPAGKNARIAELVSRSEGAGLGELASVTGWQRHTVRAALTRLRQAGFAVELRTAEDGRRTYHHAAGTEASS